jgi:hypothetical protein
VRVAKTNCKTNLIEQMNTELEIKELEVEELEERIAPGAIGNPGTSQAPQVPAGNRPNPNP